MSFLVPVGYCGSLETWAPVKNDHLVTSRILELVQHSDRVLGTGDVLRTDRAALLSPTRSSQPAVFPAGIFHPGKEWQVCAGAASTTCGSLYHLPCRKKVSGPRRSLYPWEPSLLSGPLGSVLLCPLQHNANPHLHHAAEAS